jgi:hypothetical protein
LPKDLGAFYQGFLHSSGSTDNWEIMYSNWGFIGVLTLTTDVLSSLSPSGVLSTASIAVSPESYSAFALLTNKMTEVDSWKI